MIASHVCLYLTYLVNVLLDMYQIAGYPELFAPGNTEGHPGKSDLFLRQKSQFCKLYIWFAIFHFLVVRDKLSHIAIKIKMKIFSLGSVA